MTLALVHNKPTYRPREWQVAAKEAFLSHRSDKGCLIVAATGGGKTAFGHYLAVDYLDRGERVLWIADQKTLVKQPFATLTRWWPDLVGKAGIVMAGRNEPDAQIVYASKDTIRNDKRMTQLLEAGAFALVVADECFPASAKVSRADGWEMPIGLAKVGDLVACVDHITGELTYRSITRTFSKVVHHSMCQVWYGDSTFTSTPDHPVFVKGKGYVKAEDVVLGDLLCVRRSVHRGATEGPAAPYDLLDEVCGRLTEGLPYSDLHLQQLRSLVRSEADSKQAEELFAGVQEGSTRGCAGQDEPPVRIGQDAGTKPDARPGSAQAGVADTAPHRARAEGEGREREGSYRGGTSTRGGDGSGVDHARHRGDRDAAGLGVSAALQAGHRAHLEESGDRGGRREPLQPGQEVAGREEGGLLAWARVDRVARHEQGGTGGTRVYNIEVEGAHTYFVNGALVHNCHKSVSPTWLKVLQQAGAGARLLGLTATPHRDDTKNLSDLWDLAYSYGILDAIEDRVLVPPFVTIEKVPHLDLSKVRSSGGDYNAEDLGEALLKAHIVEHTVAAMAQTYVYEELPFREAKVMEGLRGRQVLIHTATKEQARLTAGALNKDGWTARYVSGDTPESEVERLFALFSERKIDVLLAAQKLSVGVDLPVADAQVFASPTRSWVLYVQRLGRGLRTHGEKKNCLVLDLVGCTKDHSIVSAPVLVDGVDCEKSEDGRHRFLAVEGSGEGRCQDCGKVIKCMKRLSGHEFKDGRCKACGAPQCAESPDKQHHFVPWEDHKRSCIHCALEIPDPLAALVDRSPSQKEPVNWQAIKAPRKVWGASIGKIGTLFTVQHGDDAFRVFMHTRDKLIPLAPETVDGRIARMLTDDVARRGTKVRGFYGGAEIKAAKISFVRMEALARKLRVWEA